MPQLKSSTGTATLGASASSQKFYSNGGVMHVYLSGDASTNTLSLKACRTKDGTYDTYYVDDVTGTPEAQAFTVTDVPASSMYHRCYLEHGMYFQFSTNGTGTPSWEIEVNGPHVQVFDS